MVDYSDKDRWNNPFYKKKRLKFDLPKFSPYQPELPPIYPVPVVQNLFKVAAPINRGVWATTDEDGNPLDPSDPNRKQIAPYVSVMVSPEALPEGYNAPFKFTFKLTDKDFNPILYTRLLPSPENPDFYTVQEIDLYIDFVIKGSATYQEDYDVPFDNPSDYSIDGEPSIGYRGSILLPAGQSSTELWITSINDNIDDEDDETIIIGLSPNSDYNIYKGFSSAKATITTRSLIISLSAYSPVTSSVYPDEIVIDEANTSPLEYRFKPLLPSNLLPPTNPIIVRFLLGGIATYNQDYVIPPYNNTDSSVYATLTGSYPISYSVSKLEEDLVTAHGTFTHKGEILLPEGYLTQYPVSEENKDTIEDQLTVKLFLYPQADDESDDHESIFMAMAMSRQFYRLPLDSVISYIVEVVATYKFKVFTIGVDIALSPILKLQGFGLNNDITIENSVNYERVGLVNTGTGYIAIARLGDTYLFDVGGTQDIIALTTGLFSSGSIPFFSWYHGNTLFGQDLYNSTVTETPLLTINPTDYSSLYYWGTTGVLDYRVYDFTDKSFGFGILGKSKIEFPYLSVSGKPINLTPPPKLPTAIMLQLNSYTYSVNMTSADQQESSLLEIAHTLTEEYVADFAGIEILPGGGFSYSKASCSNTITKESIYNYTEQSSQSIDLYALSSNGLTKIHSVELTSNKTLTRTIEGTVSRSEINERDINSVVTSRRKQFTQSETITTNGEFTEGVDDLFYITETVTVPYKNTLNTTVMGTDIYNYNVDAPVTSINFSSSNENISSYSHNINENTTITEYRDIPSRVFSSDGFHIIKNTHLDKETVTDYVVTVNAPESYPYAVGAWIFSDKKIEETITKTGSYLNKGSLTNWIKFVLGENVYTIDNNYKGFVIISESYTAEDEIISVSNLSYMTQIGIDSTLWRYGHLFSESTVYVRRDYTSDYFEQSQETTNVSLSHTKTPVNFLQGLATNIEFFEIKDGIVKYGKGTMTITTSVQTQTFDKINYDYYSITGIGITSTSLEVIDFVGWDSVIDEGIVIVPDSDHTISVIQYINQDNLSVNCYEQDGKMRIAIASKPPDPIIDNSPDAPPIMVPISTDIGIGDTVTGVIPTLGVRDNYYKLVLGNPTYVTIRLSGLEIDVDLYLYKQTDMDNAVGSSTNGGTKDEVISLYLSARTYYIKVSGNGVGASNYSLTVELGKVYADIYEFDTVGKKFIRIGNDESDLSMLDSESDFISYHP